MFAFYNTVTSENNMWATNIFEFSLRFLTLVYSSTAQCLCADPHSVLAISPFLAATKISCEWLRSARATAYMHVIKSSLIVENFWRALSGLLNKILELSEFIPMSRSSAAFFPQTVALPEDLATRGFITADLPEHLDYSLEARRLALPDVLAEVRHRLCCLVYLGIALSDTASTSNLHFEERSFQFTVSNSFSGADAIPGVNKRSNSGVNKRSNSGVNGRSNSGVNGRENSKGSVKGGANIEEHAVARLGHPEDPGRAPVADAEVGCVCM